MQTLKDLKPTKQKNSLQRVLVRVDYNVPMKGNKILDTRRIEASFETIRTLQKKGFQVRLLAHLGDASASLAPIAKFLAKYFKVKFVKDITEDLGQIEKDTVVLFENIRQYEGEEKNDSSFTKALSKLGDVYVNDAFSVSHRKHASVVGVAKYLPSYAGIQMEKEIKNLSSLLTIKKHPFLFILGGAKFSTKIPLLKRFIESADNVVISGAILNSFYKTAGFEVGKSIVEDGYEKQVKKILSSPKLLLPTDVVVTRGNKKIILPIDEVQKFDIIEDIGPNSIRLISEKIKKAKLVVWNGPTGWYEKGFVGGTVALAEAISASKADAVVGGGDTGALVEKIAGNSKNVFVSTGGGATLEYLAKGTLPGIQYLK